MDITIDKLAFESIQPRNGFTLKVFYLSQPDGQALAEIYYNDQPYKRFLWPSYKIFNLQAHWEDIVQSEISGDHAGYDVAGWTGFNVIAPSIINNNKP